MSARTPFVPFGSQQNFAPPSGTANDGPTFIPNPGNALHRGSGQPNSDTENAVFGRDAKGALPVAGLLGQRPNRTVSYGGSAPKNLSQMAAAATLNRPQTTAPGQGNLGDGTGGRQKPQGMLPSNEFNIDKIFERIISPVPINAAQQKPSILTSPSIGPFKTPALPSRASTTAPDRSLDFSGAHISSDMHPQRRSRGVPVRQQPSPDPSNKSGSSDEQLHTIDLSGSFRTSTPSDRSRGRDASAIRAQRVLRQDYGQDQEDDRSAYYGHVSASNDRRRSREHYFDEDDSAELPPKRHKGSREPQPPVVTRHPDPLDDEDVSNDQDLQQCCDDVSVEAPSQNCALSQILDCNLNQLVRNQLEHFNNQSLIWQAAPDDEWESGGEELKLKFENFLKKAQDCMKKKRDLVTSLENRLAERQKYLRDRKEALMMRKGDLANGSQNVLEGKFSG